METPLETHFVTDDFKQEFFFSKSRRVQWKDKQMMDKKWHKHLLTIWHMDGTNYHKFKVLIWYET